MAKVDLNRVSPSSAWLLILLFIVAAFALWRLFGGVF